MDAFHFLSLRLHKSQAEMDVAMYQSILCRYIATGTPSDTSAPCQAPPMAFLLCDLTISIHAQASAVLSLKCSSCVFYRRSQEHIWVSGSQHSNRTALWFMSSPSTSSELLSAPIMHMHFNSNSMLACQLHGEVVALLDWFMPLRPCWEKGFQMGPDTTISRPHDLLECSECCAGTSAIQYMARPLEALAHLFHGKLQRQCVYCRHRKQSNVKECWFANREYNEELLIKFHQCVFKDIIRTDFILVYIKNSGRIIFRNSSDVHLLPHLYLQTTYELIKSENSGELFFVKMSCALHQKF